MAYDIEEQEQLDALKAWWKAHGNKVAAIVGIAVAAFAGMQGWKYYQHQQTLRASAKYEALSATDGKEIKSIQAISAELMDQYASTPYAGRAALLVAKANYNAKDVKSAKSQLEWAADNAREDAVKALARLQLAAIQLEEKAYEDALKTLAKKSDPGFSGLFADLRGDIFAAQGKNAEAKAAYQEALTRLDTQGQYRRYTEHKLEALGG